MPSEYIHRSFNNPKPHTSNVLDVLDNDLAIGDGNGGQNLVLLDVDDGGILRTNGRAILGSGAAGESHGAKVGKGNQGVILLKVLDDPLSVVLTQIAINTPSEAVGDRGTGAHVLNRGGTSGVAAGIDGDLDGITGRDGDVAEVVGVVGVPLVPGIEAHLTALDTKVHTGLEDSGVTGVTVNAHPGGGTVLLAARATRGHRGGGHDELGGHGSVASANQDGTGPVGAVLDVLGAIEGKDLVGARLEGRVALAVRGALGPSSLALGRQRSGHSRGGQQASGQESSGLHLDREMYVK